MTAKFFKAWKLATSICAAIQFANTIIRVGKLADQMQSLAEEVKRLSQPEEAPEYDLQATRGAKSR